MKKVLTILALAAMAGIASAQTYVTNLVPSGEFTSGFNGGDWTNNSGGGTFVFSYPTAGGNPGGYALMDGTAGGMGWGVFVGAVYDGTASGLPIPLTTFQLTAGIPCTVLMDMKIESGANIGGLKLESYNVSDTLIVGSDIEQRPTIISTGWETYSFTYTPPVGATGIKFVPLWGANSSIGYDNVKVIATTSLPLTASITAPAASATVNTNFTINATAAVLPGSVTNVNFYRGGTILLGNDETAPYSLSVVGATLGAAALTVVAQDANGNSATSAIVNVTVTGAVVETIVKVDPTKTWLGYMNVYERPEFGGAFVFDSPWGVDALSAAFSGVGPASVLTLKPAPINNPVAFWYDPPPGGPGVVGNKDMEATMYVQAPDGTLNGNLVTFMGTCINNTLVSPSVINGAGNGWTNYAFIKDFAPDYLSFTETNIALTTGTPFSISLLTDANAARHIQYGFITRGPNVWPTDVDNYGSVVIRSLDASPTNVYVDSSKTWLGFMNRFETPANGGGYAGGSSWGTADLKAIFDSFGLTLSPNNIGDPAPYWYVGGGGPGAVGNKIMDASMYVELPTGTVPGRNVIFSGTVLSNTLVSASNTNEAGNGWTSVAFIKDFAPDYSSSTSVTVPLTPGAFSINLNTVNDPARHVQYGFQTVGPNVWVTDVAGFGNVLIGNVGVFPTTITPSKSGGNFELLFPTQLGLDYTVQYKTNLTDVSWNTLTVTNGTGLNAIVSDPTGNSQRFYQLSIE